MSDINRQDMMEVFTFETGQMLEQLEQIVIEAENGYSQEQINEIFRIMHTIKGSAAMMMFQSIAKAGHAIEDLFYYIREKHPLNIDNSMLTDYVLESMDFLKDELAKIQGGGDSDGDPTEVARKISEYLVELKEQNNDGPPPAPAEKPDETAAVQTKTVKYSEDDLRVLKAVIFFQDGCEMENVRAYTLLYNLKNLVHDVTNWPENLIDEGTIGDIRENGFRLEITTNKSYEDIYTILSGTIYARDIILTEIKAPGEEAKLLSDNDLTSTAGAQKKKPDEGAVQQPKAEIKEQHEKPEPRAAVKEPAQRSAPAEQDNNAAVAAADAVKKSPVSAMISVNVSKLDALMRLVGELVIAEAMVTQNTDLDVEGLSLENFQKDARQLRKIISDLRTTIMSTRMLTLTHTFFRMNRIVRDMCKQLGKEVQLEVIGEETEVDKNIVDYISDPIMHIVRNAVDHGIETPAERKKKGKPEQGTVTLEARTVGSDVVITVADDGAGLDKERILQKAMNNGLLHKPASDYTDKEIYQFIFMPGFSTNTDITSFSGRGVGMDVVNKNMDAIKGTTIIDSTPGEGSVITMKIPLTMAIIKGMNIMMGGEKYTVPIDAISKSFVPKKADMFVDPNGNEMITVYDGAHLNVVRLYEFFDTPEAARDVEDGLMMIVENDTERICLFIDELVAEQSVVVLKFPSYLPKIPGLSGCTLLGNGEISLIIEPAAFFIK